MYEILLSSAVAFYFYFIPKYRIDRLCQMGLLFLLRKIGVKVGETQIEIQELTNGASHWFLSTCLSVFRSCNLQCVKNYVEQRIAIIPALIMRYYSPDGESTADCDRNAIQLIRAAIF